MITNALQQALGPELDRSCFNYSYNTITRASTTLLSDFSYTRTISSPDSMVPLWTTVPKPRETVYPRLMDVCNNLPAVKSLAEKYNFWIINIILQSVFSVSRNASDTYYLLDLVTNRTGRQQQDAIKRVLSVWSAITSTEDTVKNAAKRDLRAVLRMLMPKRYDKNSGFTYTLAQTVWADHPHRLDFHSMLSSGTGLTKVSTFRRVAEDKSYSYRYGYLGILGNHCPGDYQEVYPVVPTNLIIPPAGTAHAPTISSIYGINSCYCIMIKASKQAEIAAQIAIRSTPELALEREDLELWQQTNIAQLLPPSIYKTYRREIYSFIRNTLNCSVRTFDNLSKALFDIDTDKPTIENYDNFITTRLNQARIRSQQIGRSNHFQSI